MSARIPARFRCPCCEMELVAYSTDAGLINDCPRCQTPVRVPDPLESTEEEIIPTESTREKPKARKPAHQPEVTGFCCEKCNALLKKTGPTIFCYDGFERYEMVEDCPKCGHVQIASCAHCWYEGPICGFRGKVSKVDGGHRKGEKKEKSKDEYQCPDCHVKLTRICEHCRTWSKESMRQMCPRCGRIDWKELATVLGGLCIVLPLFVVLIVWLTRNEIISSGLMALLLLLAFAGAVYGFLMPIATCYGKLRHAVKQSRERRR